MEDFRSQYERREQNGNGTEREKYPYFFLFLYTPCDIITQLES